jgi:TatD DNase family protein
VELCDSHCHLYVSPLAEELERVLARARAAGVSRIVVPGNDLASFAAVRELGRRPGLFPAFGLHPWVADELLELDALATLVREARAVALGEIGLDFAIAEAAATAPRAAEVRARQLAILEAQLALAVDLGLPVLLHCRAAFEELLALLARFAPRLRGVVHAFSRGPDLARRFLALGLHLAFGGALTRARPNRAQRAVVVVPEERLLLETDAPSIGLEGVPPERVEPHHTLPIAEAMARLRGAPLEAIARSTTENARRLLALP